MNTPQKGGWLPLGPFQLLPRFCRRGNGSSFSELTEDMNVLRTKPKIVSHCEHSIKAMNVKPHDSRSALSTLVPLAIFKRLK